MATFFLSYSKSDEKLATIVVATLERESFSTWHWRRDMVHSQPHPEQTFAHIDNCAGFICIVSRESAHSDFMFPEILRASAQKKPFLVILHDLTYPDLQEAFPRWTQAFGFSPALESSDEFFARRVVEAARSTADASPQKAADRIDHGAYQLGRLLYLLNIFEIGLDQGEVSHEELQSLRRKIVGFYSLVFDRDLNEFSAATLGENCDRRIVHAKASTFSAFRIGNLWQIFALAKGDVARIKSLLPALAKNKLEVLNGLPNATEISSSVRILYDHAQTGESLTTAEFLSCRSALTSYFDPDSSWRSPG